MRADTTSMDIPEVTDRTLTRLTAVAAILGLSLLLWTLLGVARPQARVTPAHAAPRPPAVTFVARDGLGLGHSVFDQPRHAQRAHTSRSS
jgi:hypothetical protein